MIVRLLSGGAAQGLVAALAPSLETEAGIRVEGTFGAVGAMRERLLAGVRADLVILTAALVRDLAAGGHVLGDEAADLGSVATAVAARAGDPAPSVGNGDALRAALLAADAIYMPDPEKATAGIHFASVLDRLGITNAVRGRLRTFPNGATAMRALAGAEDRRPLGCTQVTEIVATVGLTLLGPLPLGYGLSTVYTAALCRDASEPDAARELIRRLTDASAGDLRLRLGFEEVRSARDTPRLP